METIEVRCAFQLAKSLEGGGVSAMVAGTHVIVCGIGSIATDASDKSRLSLASVESVSRAELAGIPVASPDLERQLNELGITADQLQTLRPRRT